MAGVTQHAPRYVNRSRVEVVKTQSSGGVRRASAKKLTRRERAQRPLVVALTALFIIALSGGVGAFVHPTFGIIVSIAVATAYLGALFSRDLALLRISAAKTEALGALFPLRRDQVYPLNPATLSPENSLTLCHEIVYRRPKRILELGSGSSTVFMARCLESLGDDEAKIICLEHVEFWCGEVRRMIEQAGLTDRVQVLHAPIVENELEDAATSIRWYDLSVLAADAGPFDFVLVDGPEGGKGDPLARYGAFPLLRQRLAPGALLLLDDGVREGETEIVRKWVKMEPRLQATFIKSEEGLWSVELPGG